MAAESPAHRMLRTLGLQRLTRDGLHGQLKTLWPATSWNQLSSLLRVATERGYVLQENGRWARTAAGAEEVKRLAGLASADQVDGPEPEVPAAAETIEPPAPSPDPAPLPAPGGAPCAPRRSASFADLAPPPRRPGADDALQQPSRIGNRLHYRDGRVTNLAGMPVSA
jgi:hypothetical protein